MDYKEVTKRVNRIKEIIKEIDATTKSGESLALDEISREFSSMHSAFFSKLKEFYKDRFQENLFEYFFPPPSYIIFKQKLEVIVKEQPSFPRKSYVEECDKYITLYDRMKDAVHIRSDLNYEEMFKQLDPMFPGNPTVIGGAPNSGVANDGDEQPLPDDNGNYNGELPMDITNNGTGMSGVANGVSDEQPLPDYSGNYNGEFPMDITSNGMGMPGVANNVPDEQPILDGSGNYEVPIPGVVNTVTDEQPLPDGSGSCVTPIGNNGTLENEREKKRREEEEEKNKKAEEERLRKAEEEKNRIEEERKRKEEEEKKRKEEERKRKEEEEKKRLNKLFKEKFLSLFIKGKQTIPEEKNEIRQLLFENGFIFSKEVFTKIYSISATDKRSLNEMYADVLILKEEKNMKIHEYPADKTEKYPEGILYHNIFNGVKVKKDVLYITDPKQNDIDVWLSANKDSLKEVKKVKFYKKSVPKTNVQEELRKLRSSKDDLPLWHVCASGYSNVTLIIATTSGDKPKCSESFLNMYDRDINTEIIDKFTTSKLEIIPFTEIDKEICIYGNSCVLFTDPKHMEEYYHPHDANVCPNIAFCNKPEPGMTHICKNGLKCWDINKKDHLKSNIHTKICEERSCNEKSLAHRAGGHPGTVSKRDVEKLENLTLCSCSNINTTRGWPEALVPNFDLNVAVWMEKCKEYIGKDIEKTNYNFKSISNWFAGLLPVHLCPGSGLTGILKMGAITSLDTLVNMWKTPDVIIIILILFIYLFFIL